MNDDKLKATLENMAGAEHLMRHENTEPAKRYLILAHSYHDFKDWCRDHNISLRDARFVYDIDRLRGLTGKKWVIVVLFGNVQELTAHYGLWKLAKMYDYIISHDMTWQNEALIQEIAAWVRERAAEAAEFAKQYLLKEDDLHDFL
jgi:hypothetical protein